MSKIKLGQKVRDKVTGFTGTVTAKVEYLNGCVQYCVMPKAKEEGKLPTPEYIDVQQLEIFKEKVEIVSRKSGGVVSNIPNTNYKG